jgi:hypothetical protein
VLDDLHFGAGSLVIPEPTSIALLGFGGLCLVFRRRRNQRQPV